MKKVGTVIDKSYWDAATNLNNGLNYCLRILKLSPGRYPCEVVNWQKKRIYSDEIPMANSVITRGPGLRTSYCPPYHHNVVRSHDPNIYCGHIDRYGVQNKTLGVE